MHTFICQAVNVNVSVQFNNYLTSKLVFLFSEYLKLLSTYCTH